MPYLHISQKFADYPTWHKAFEALTDARRQAGIETVLLMLTAHDSHEAVVPFKVADPDRLRDHFTSSALQVAHARGGVVARSTQAMSLVSPGSDL